MINLAISGISPEKNTELMLAQKIKESKLDIRIIIFAYGEILPSTFTNIDKVYLITSPLENSGKYLEELGIIHQTEVIDILIPVLQPEVSVFQHIRESIDAMGIKPIMLDTHNNEEQIGTVIEKIKNCIKSNQDSPRSESEEAQLRG